MLYHFYEMNHAAFAPARALASANIQFWQNSGNPLANTSVGRGATAMLTMFERATRRFAKPEFGIKDVSVDGEIQAVAETVVLDLPFCRLLHFLHSNFKSPFLKECSV